MVRVSILLEMRYNKSMFVVGLLGWWYQSGWRDRRIMIKERLARARDYFSIDLLVRTWFAPFRQISADRVQGPVNVQIRAWFDRLISRIIGGIVRTIIMLIGIVWLVLQSLAGLIELLFWLLLPAFPVIGAIIMSLGWSSVWTQ